MTSGPLLGGGWRRCRRPDCRRWLRVYRTTHVYCSARCRVASWFRARRTRAQEESA